MIQHRISQFIDKEHLFTLKENILVALSGGADSVALLRVLLSMGYTCEAAHCNFHLRGEESNRDEAFVRNLCHGLNVPLNVAHFDTEQHAIEQHISIEMAARELRYRWFAELKEKINVSAIAVGHHQEDSIETMLLNLIRGTGINGLTGIRPKNGDIVRPLLCVHREEIIAYLHRINQTFVTDSTNLQDEFTRNKIRLNLLPLMQEINPSVKESILETIHHLQSASLVYNRGIVEGGERVFSNPNEISIAALLNEPSPEALLFEILYPLGFNSSQIKGIATSLTGQPGKQFISKEWRVIKDREWLLVEKLGADASITPSFHLHKEEHEYASDFVIPREKNIACFDADKLDDEITIRKWKTGDHFVPFGMTGRKLVSDYLTDRKFPLNRKENQWVLCCGNRIAWLIGERTDNNFRVDEQTKRVIIYKLIDSL